MSARPRVSLTFRHLATLHGVKIFISAVARGHEVVHSQRIKWYRKLLVQYS